MSSGVLVTGGGGFIGSHLVEGCLERGLSVRVLDDFSTGDERNLAPVEDSIELIRGDVRSRETVREAVRNVRWVFHQAAVPSVPRSFQEPVGSTEVNLMGTLNVLEEARRSDVERVVYASSSSVYGDEPDLPNRESQPPAPRSPYAASKAACETFADILGNHFDLPTVGLRYFNVFGPRQDPGSDYAAVIPNFIEALLEGERPVIYGDGEQTRDFTYVSDVVQANLRAAEEADPGRVYNVSRNRRVSVNELLETLQAVTDVGVQPRYTDPRPGDVRHSQGDGSALREAAGYVPDTDLESGLHQTVQWFENHPDRWRRDEP